MELLTKIYSIFYLINLLLALTVIFLERRNVAATWSWLMVLLFLPVLGFILYILFGQNLRRRKIYNWKKEEVHYIQSLINQQLGELERKELIVTDPILQQYERLISLNLQGNGSLLTSDNVVKVKIKGEDKFGALFQSIAQAKDHIHMLYYIIRNDELGRSVVEALTKKAEQGVEVRVLYDAVGSSALSRSFFAPLEKAGGQVATFFPAKIPYLNFLLNHRNHRKLTIIDGRIGFIGGFNIGNEYLGLKADMGNWRDTHLQFSGSAVHALQAIFMGDWNLSSSQQLTFDKRYFPPQTTKGEIPMQIVSSGPESKWRNIQNSYLQMIISAKESVYLQTPYFVPNDSLQNALIIAALSGIDVRVMIPRKSDNVIVDWASSSYLGMLLEAGVKCYLYETGFLHAKMMVVDGEVASVGTANIDTRSFKLNFEVTAFIYHKETAHILQQIFLEDMTNCSQLTLATYEQRPTKQRLKESVARLLSPIL